MNRVHPDVASLVLSPCGCQSTNVDGVPPRQRRPRSRTPCTPGRDQVGAGPPSLLPGRRWRCSRATRARTGFFAMRLRFPDGYKVMPHWHPKHERVTSSPARSISGMATPTIPPSADADRRQLQHDAGRHAPLRVRQGRDRDSAGDDRPVGDQLRQSRRRPAQAGRHVRLADANLRIPRFCRWRGLCTRTLSSARYRTGIDGGSLCFV